MIVKIVHLKNNTSTYELGGHFFSYTLFSTTVVLHLRARRSIDPYKYRAVAVVFKAIALREPVRHELNQLLHVPKGADSETDW